MGAAQFVFCHVEPNTKQERERENIAVGFVVAAPNLKALID